MSIVAEAMLGGLKDASPNLCEAGSRSKFVLPQGAVPAVAIGGERRYKKEGRAEEEGLQRPREMCGEDPAHAKTLALARGEAAPGGIPRGSAVGGSHAGP